jgi:hypothetical protein
MAFADQYALGVDPAFRARVEMALIKASTAVMAEVQNVDGHDLRATYATYALNNPASASGPMAMAVAGNPAITAESVDGDLEFTVNSLFSAMAGHSTGPTS